MASSLQWYLQRDGKASGPYSLDDLRDQVRQGLLLGHDLVFQEGAEAWKRAFDWPELASEIFSEERTSFTRLFTLPRSAAAPPEDWIVLLRFEEPDGLRFKQEGPYSTDQVRELLQSGKMKPSDHLWRKGYPAWVAVYMEPDFSPSLWNLKSESAPLLKSVVEAPEQKPVVTTPEPVLAVEPAVSAKPSLASLSVHPPEMPSHPAEDEDLSDAVTASGVMPVPSVAPPAPSSQVFPPQEFTTSAKVEFSPTPLPSPPRRSLRFVGMGAALAVLAILGAGYYKRDAWLSKSGRPWILHTSQNSPEASDVLSGEDEAATQVSAPKVEVPQAPTPAPVAEATPAPSAPPAPARQVIWSYSLAGLSKNPVVVMITGYSGRVLQVQALNLRVSLDAPQNGRLDLDPRDYKLPEGEFLVQIFQNGKLLVRDDKSTVEDPEKFAKKIRDHRKQIAFDQQQEKRALLKTLDQMQSFVGKYRSELTGKSVNAKAKKVLQKDFDALARSEMKTVRLSRHGLMYPSGWSQAAQQYESLRSSVASIGSRRPASKQDVENQRKKLVQLRTQVSQISLGAN